MRRWSFRCQRFRPSLLPPRAGLAGGQGERCLLRTEKMRSANRECHWLWRASKPIPEGVLEGAREYDRRYGGSAGWPWLCLGIKCAPHTPPPRFRRRAIARRYTVPPNRAAPHTVPPIGGTVPGGTIPPGGSAVRRRIRRRHTVPPIGGATYRACNRRHHTQCRRIRRHHTPCRQ